MSGLISHCLKNGVAQSVLVTVATRMCGGCICTCVLVYVRAGDEGLKGVEVVRRDLNCTRHGAYMGREKGPYSGVLRLNSPHALVVLGELTRQGLPTEPVPVTFKKRVCKKVFWTSIHGRGVGTS